MIDVHQSWNGHRLSGVLQDFGSVVKQAKTAHESAPRLEKLAAKWPKVYRKHAFYGRQRH
jgi:hypothetical protein